MTWLDFHGNLALNPISVWKDSKKFDPLNLKPDPFYLKFDPLCLKPDPLILKSDPIEFKPDPFNLKSNPDDKYPY